MAKKNAVVEKQKKIYPKGYFDPREDCFNFNAGPKNCSKIYLNPNCGRNRSKHGTPGGSGHR